jgi:hypothetical protein
VTDPPDVTFRNHRLPSEIVFHKSDAVCLPVTASGLSGLPRAFSGMFDQAACAIRGEGFDLDEVIVERWLVCRGESGAEARIPAEPLSNPAQLVAVIKQALRTEARGGALTVIAVEVVVVKDG